MCGRPRKAVLVKVDSAGKNVASYEADPVRDVIGAGLHKPGTCVDSRRRKNRLAAATCKKVQEAAGRPEVAPSDGTGWGRGPES